MARYPQFCAEGRLRSQETQLHNVKKHHAPRTHTLTSKLNRPWPTICPPFSTPTKSTRRPKTTRKHGSQNSRTHQSHRHCLNATFPSLGSLEPFFDLWGLPPFGLVPGLHLRRSARRGRRRLFLIHPDPSRGHARSGRRRGRP